ncbi:Transcriptional regulator, MarR family [Rhodovulum sp. PH10]|uniref:MarR family winged helix-turn-helix transcriptional regulator n=1 Tax=Rhodovulum sp. PH10 TaxID=1187851 RepID=UPI00027C2141|nr:MarR family transcriptional regulator [Rhodovulum sp. PH10]EJW13538.1 Transcriptional regulator, MarR family [Rhodovulum sp. PH10]
MTDDDAKVVGALEQEFAFLARALEAINRKRTYPMERAHYLLLLRLEDGPASITTLATGLALDDSTVTRQVAAMEALGLVKRVAHPADRRSALIEPTAEGRARAAEMRAVRIERIGALFASWAAADRAALADYLGRVNGLLADMLRRLDAGAADAPAAGGQGAGGQASGAPLTGAREDDAPRG